MDTNDISTEVSASAMEQWFLLTNELSTSSGSNISVTIPNLVRQMRISVFNFVSVAKPQTFEEKHMMGKDSASGSHPLPSTYQLTQSARQGNRRHLKRNCYPSNAESMRPPPSHLSHPGPRNTAAPGIIITKMIMSLFYEDDIFSIY